MWYFFTICRSLLEISLHFQVHKNDLVDSLIAMVKATGSTKKALKISQYWDKNAGKSAAKGFFAAFIENSFRMILAIVVAVSAPHQQNNCL